MAKEDLIPFTQRTEEEVKQMNIKGGIKSGEKRRKNKVFREAILAIIDLPAPQEMLEDIQEAFKIGKETTLTIKEAMIFAQALVAIRKGNTKAFLALVEQVDGKAAQSLVGKDGESLFPDVILYDDIKSVNN
jgi:hypothetical protein